MDKQKALDRFEYLDPTAENARFKSHAYHLEAGYYDAFVVQKTMSDGWGWEVKLQDGRGTCVFYNYTALSGDTQDEAAETVWRLVSSFKPMKGYTVEYQNNDAVFTKEEGYETVEVFWDKPASAWRCCVETVEDGGDFYMGLKHYDSAEAARVAAEAKELEVTTL